MNILSESLTKWYLLFYVFSKNMKPPRIFM